jgi:cellulose synthase/poly-beta-1,6-N-acetylglucosamine synthase-like glycosyltransferase
MELIIRLHRELRKRKKPYRITFVPDPICWTEAPEDLTTLKHQRERWQRGLTESLMLNKELLFSRHSGAVGWLAFPYMLMFEWFGPVIEFAGIVIVLLGFLSGYLQTDIVLVFFIVAVGFGMLLSVVAVLLEEMSFHIYEKPQDIFRLFIAAFFENFGYRQLNMYWRMLALIKWAFGTKANWGQMKRNASWKQEDRK